MKHNFKGIKHAAKNCAAKSELWTTLVVGWEVEWEVEWEVGGQGGEKAVVHTWIFCDRDLGKIAPL